MLVDSMECRGSCIFRRLALELRCFREPLPSLRMLESSRIRLTFPPCDGSRSLLESRAHLSVALAARIFRRSRRARPTSSRVRAHVAVLTLAQRVQSLRRNFRLCSLPFTHVSRYAFAFAPALPNTPTARVHFQRIVIEEAWRLCLQSRRPARAFEPSDQTSGYSDSTAFTAGSARS